MMRIVQVGVYKLKCTVRQKLLLQNQKLLQNQNGGGIFVKFLSINLQMKINSLKPYSPPVVEVLNVELEQSVLGNSISTESLEEETYNW